MRRIIATLLFFALVVTTSSYDAIAANNTAPKNNKTIAAKKASKQNKQLDLNINDSGALSEAVNSKQVKEFNDEIGTVQEESVLDSLPLRPEFRYVENEEYRGDINSRSDKEFRVKYNLSF